LPSAEPSLTTGGSSSSKGVKTKAGLMEEFYTPPPELLGLDRAELEALQRALEQLRRD
jgi:hypothetical protein